MMSSGVVGYGKPPLSDLIGALCISVVSAYVKEGVGVLRKEYRVMDSLCTGEDLLAAHEEVIRIRVVGICGIAHCVERPCLLRC